MKLLIIILCAFGVIFVRTCTAEKATPANAPVPGTPDDMDEVTPDPPPLLLKGAPPPVKLLYSFLPAAMQVMQHLAENLVYEQEGPATTTTRRPVPSRPSAPTSSWWSTTARPSSSTAKPSTTSSWWSTTARPSSSTTKPSTTSSWWSTTARPSSTISWWLTTTKHTTTQATITKPTNPHRPGIYGPANPPEPEESNQEKPEIDEEKPEINVETPENPTLSDITSSKPTGSVHLQSSGNGHAEFLNWFLSRRFARNIKGEVEENWDNLQYLAQQPRDVLLQIRDHQDIYEDADFLDDQTQVLAKWFDMYDDNDDLDRSRYARKKRIPPTRAYVELLMLYDLLKRDAKTQKFELYQGYAPEVIKVLVETSSGTSVQQLHTVLSKMLQRNDATRPDVISRSKTMVTDLEDPKSAISLAVAELQPLKFSF